MSFRASIRRALSAPLGGSLASRFGAAAVTAILTEGGDGARDAIALAELADALTRAGVPRGRQFVLLTGAGAASPDARARAHEMRDVLGLVVLVHDPARSAFHAGRLGNGVPVEVDDELREAEAVVIAGRHATGADGRVHGGAAALLPGAASAAARAAFEAALGDAGAGARADAALALSLEALGLVPADFALAWSADDPPRVLAGDARTVEAAARRDGWLGPRGVGGA